MKVAMYCRVGNANQLALESQRKRLQEYIQSHPDWREEKYYADIRPANRLDENSAVVKMLNDATLRKFHRLVVPSVSRLTRDPDSLILVLEKLSDCGVIVDFIEEQITSVDLLQPGMLFPVMPTKLKAGRRKK